MCEDVGLTVDNLSVYPISSDTSLSAKVFNSRITYAIQDVLEGGMYDVLSKLTDLDLLANRPISLISNMSKQGRSKTDNTVLRSVCQTVAIPKLICSTDLFVLERNVLPIVQNMDTDPTLVQHLIRLIETLRAPLNFETSSSPRTVQYRYAGEHHLAVCSRVLPYLPISMQRDIGVYPLRHLVKRCLFCRAFRVL